MRDTRLFIRFMPNKVSLNLQNRIEQTLITNNSCLWFPHLTYELAQTGWQKLTDNTGITESDYGTARVVSEDSDAPRDIAHSLLFKNQVDEINGKISVELLPKNIADSYKKSGVNFYKLKELFIKEKPSEILESLRDAFAIISKTPSLFATVITLVKCVHLIKPELDDYDVSFSEPDIPFSIFVSLPRQNDEISILRVAEAIVHESMHLQLTLIEKNFPLVFVTTAQHYSPWRAEYRSVGGVLHALYVFRVIYCFFQKLNKLKIITVKSEKYTNERLKEIYLQIDKIQFFLECSDLTPLGKKLVQKLMKTMM